MRGELSQEHATDVLGHLLSDCPQCRETTGSNWGILEHGLRAAREEVAESESQDGGTYRDSLDRAFSIATEYSERYSSDGIDAPRLFSKLGDHSHARRLTQIRNSSEYHRPAFCDWLIEESFSVRFSDSSLSVELAQLAAEVAEQIDARLAGPSLPHDYRCRANAYLANALRVASDLDGAWQAIHVAKKEFDSGSQDPLDRALLLRFEAHILRTQRRFDQSNRLQKRALLLYLECGEVASAARLYIDRGLGALYSGSPHDAIKLFGKAKDLLADKREPAMEAMIDHNVAYCLHDLDRFKEAALVLQQLRQESGEPSEKLNRLRRRWLEGKIQFGLGELEQSEKTLLEVRDGFIEAGIAYDVASVSVDLAGTYASQGRVGEIRQLAAEMFQLFEAQEIHREALAALVIFRQAAEVEGATLALVKEISSYLRRVRQDPSLKFRPSS